MAIALKFISCHLAAVWNCKVQEKRSFGSQRMGEKLETCLDSHRQLLDKTRSIQDPDQFASKK